MANTKTIELELHAKDTSGNGPGGFTAVLSAPTVDRDGEIVSAKAFEPLPDHITIDIDHGLTVATTVGSARPYYSGDLLMADVKFSSIPRAQEVRTLVQEGHLKKMSVVFINPEGEWDEAAKAYRIKSAELLNATITGIPSNRETDITDSKTSVAGDQAVWKELTTKWS